MINIPDFIKSVADLGFTRACNTHNVDRLKLKKMCDIIINNNIIITPYNTKQQIVYNYIYIQLNKQN